MCVGGGGVVGWGGYICKKVCVQIVTALECFRQEMSVYVCFEEHNDSSVRH